MPARQTKRCMCPILTTQHQLQDVRKFVDRLCLLKAKPRCGMRHGERRPVQGLLHTGHRGRMMDGLRGGCLLQAGGGPARRTAVLERHASRWLWVEELVQHQLRVSRNLRQWQQQWQQWQ